MGDKKGGVHFEGGRPEIHGPVIGGDVGELVMGDKIVVGDVAQSNLAIGEGAQLIVNQIQQALSKVDELEKSIRVAERLLAEAVEKKVRHLARLSESAAPEALANPYKALLDYKLEDAPFFYGRTQAIKAMMGKMRQNQLTVLHSDSGSGKSSLLQAGLASRLVTQGHLPLYLRPYRQPPGAFIKRAFLPDYATQPELARFSDEQMSLRGFLARVAAYLGNGRLHIFLDQFEEFFSELAVEEQRHFAAQLQDCVQPDLPVNWVISLRKEYFSDLRLFSALRPFENEYFLPTFRSSEAQEVICEPAALKQVRFEEGLVERIIADISLDKEGIPPAQVQLVCYTLFEELQEEDDKSTISNALYNKPRGRGATGAQGILTSHLGRVLSREFSKSLRPLARQVLSALITSEKRRVVKSRETLEAEISAGQLPNLDDVLATLIKTRLLRIEEDEEDDEAYFELTHDYLLTEIELDPETQARKAAQELLNQEVILYLRFGSLLSEDRYEIINSQRDYLKIEKNAAELLQRSEEKFAAARKREEERQRALQEEQTKRRAAEEKRRQALSNRLAAEAKSLLEKDPERSLLLATAAVSSSYGQGQTLVPEARAALLEALRSPYRGTFDGHTGVVSGAAFSPDGRHLVTTGEDSTARLWDLASGECLALLEGHVDKVTGVIYAPGGARFLTYGRGGSARMWAAQDGRFLFALEGHTGWINTAEFSPNGTHILTAGQNGTTRLWAAGTGEQMREFPGNTAVYSATFDPYGHHFLTAEWDDHYRLWHINDENPRAELPGKTARRIRPVFTPDHKYIITGDQENSLRIWEWHDQERLGELVGHNSPLIGFELSRSGDYLISAAEDGSIVLWNLQGAEFTPTPLERMRAVRHVALDPLSNYCILAADTGEVRLHNMHNGDLLFDYFAHPSSISALALAADGGYFVTGGGDYRVHRWDARSAILQAGYIGHRDKILDAAFSPDGRCIATACRNKELRLWDSNSGAHLGELIDHSGPVHTVQYSRDGMRMLTAADEDYARLRDFRGRTIKILDEPPARSNVAAFSADGQEVITVAPEGTAVIWGVDGRKLAELGFKAPKKEQPWLFAGGAAVKKGEVSPHLAVFSPDGWKVVFTSDDLAPKLWDVNTRSLIAELQGHECAVRHAAFSPDGTRIATGAFDGTLRLWHGLSGAALFEMAGHKNSITAVYFDPSGERLLSAAADGSIRIWDIHSGETLDFYLGYNESGVAAITGPANDAVYSPDGRYILSAHGKIALLRNGQSGELLAEFAGHKEIINRVRFSPDGRRFLTASSTVRVWSMPPITVEDMLATSRGRLRRAFTSDECWQYFDDPEDCPMSIEVLFLVD